MSAWREAYQGVMPGAVLDRLSVDDREKTWLGQLASTVQCTWVAVGDDEVVGWISFGPSRDQGGDQSTAEVYAIYLDPKVWRRGIGRMLWQRAVAESRVQTFRQLTVWVLEENVRARAFYEAVGAVVEPARRKGIEIGEKTLIEVRYSVACESP